MNTLVKSLVGAFVVSVCTASSMAQAPATPGVANPKEVGTPGTPANAGTGASGSLNSADVRAADRSTTKPQRGASAL